MIQYSFGFPTINQTVRIYRHLRSHPRREEDYYSAIHPVKKIQRVIKRRKHECFQLIVSYVACRVIQISKHLRSLNVLGRTLDVVEEDGDRGLMS